MGKMGEKSPAKQPAVAPAKPVANKLEISPHFKLVFVVIAGLTAFCLFLGMLASLRYPDPPARPISVAPRRRGNSTSSPAVRKCAHSRA